MTVTWGVTLKVIFLFHMFSVATNLVTSLEFSAIHCSSKLCHFVRTRNGYIATHFILRSSTAESSATSGYVVVPERFDQNKETANNNKERLGKNPRLVPKVDSTDTIVLPSMYICFFK